MTQRKKRLHSPPSPAVLDSWLLFVLHTFQQKKPPRQDGLGQECCFNSWTFFEAWLPGLALFLPAYKLRLCMYACMHVCNAIFTYLSPAVRSRPEESRTIDGGFPFIKLSPCMSALLSAYFHFTMSVLFLVLG